MVNVSVVEKLCYPSQCNLEKTHLSVAGEDCSESAYDQITTEMALSPSGGEVLHFYRLHHSQAHVHCVYTGKSCGTAPQNLYQHK